MMRCMRAKELVGPLKRQRPGGASSLGEILHRSLVLSFVIASQAKESKAPEMLEMIGSQISHQLDFISSRLTVFHQRSCSTRRGTPSLVNAVFGACSP